MNPIHYIIKSTDTHYPRSNHNTIYTFILHIHSLTQLYAFIHLSYKYYISSTWLHIHPYTYSYTYDTYIYIHIDTHMLLIPFC